MSGRRQVGRLAAVALAAMLGIGPLATPAAEAAEPAGVGWWWAGRPTKGFPFAFTPVPAVPEGGFYVAGDFTGPSGIAALRFALEDDASPQALTITIAENIGAPVLDACASAAAWEAAEGGAWDERPTPDCDTSRAAGILSDDGATVRFDLFAFDANGILEVVLVPGEDPEGGPPPSFSASFEPPDGDALTVFERPFAARMTGPTPTPSGSSGTGILPDPVAPAPRFEPGPLGPPLETETGRGHGTVAAPPVETNPAFTDFPAAEGFAYPAILGLPLVMLVLASYLGRALMRPVAVTIEPRP